METTDIKFYLTLQQHELDGGALYEKIAKSAKLENERKTLETISKEEYAHAEIFAQYAGRKLKPRKAWVNWHAFLARLLGYTFIIKFLERSEDKDVALYSDHVARMPELEKILTEEQAHEQKLMDILDEERLHYVGDMVLGMNDALVELTGALAGYTLAMQNTSVIAMAGLITGVSATLSMAASGYLSSREAGEKNPVTSSLYTGIAYLITVALLIIPYLLMPKDQFILALVITLLIALSIIAGFNYYVAVAKDRKFRRSFLTMAAISLGVAAISFTVGLVVKNVLGIDL